ncbi:MAG: cysteine--tRNA ligase [Candidatus Berkelbacteria bacterium]|nr:MAG: cysteine--tRNA ligase [Candidatus Berkelbacteria bacterium]QQG51447.1 MAG: cysteine--tRNA ligase [Candidatus Berkelbacteria bacterium]
MALELYNTLTTKKEPFYSIEPHKVRMYVCGPTVYDYDHIGHARTYLSFDLLNRVLRYEGFEVNYIQNITDVGHLMNDAESGKDKIRQKAQETGETTVQVIEQFSEAHKRDMSRLNILEPDEYPKASSHIKEIIKFVEELIKKGFAYATSEGNVYFRVSRKQDYGKLSHRGIAEIVTGTRTEPAKDKLSPADFALWKAAPFGANELVWDSPWGRGFPGWHIECSTMSRKYLGDTFDIHGSAIEHIFPHHENEIAQTEALTGKTMANFWIHGGMLTVNGQKMSKSLKNTILIQEILEDFSPNEIRLAMYQTHYRRPFDYTRANMEQGVALRKKIFGAYRNLPSETNAEIWGQIIAALEDDLDTPLALQIWSQNATEISLEDTDKLFAIFGLVYRKVEEDPPAQRLAADRYSAREKKDFLTADNRKAELLQLGYDVLDTDDGTEYVPR